MSISKWQLANRGCHLDVFLQCFRDETVKAMTEERESNLLFSMGRDKFVCLPTGRVAFEKSPSSKNRFHITW